MLSIADILKADDLPPRLVSVPEWGGQVYVATLRADERDELEEMIVGRQKECGLIGTRALYVAFCLCDETGKRLFADEKLNSAVQAIGRKAAPGVQRLFNVISEMNAITKEDIEELEKN